MKCFGLSLLLPIICGCGTVAQVAAPIAIAVATKNASGVASGAGAAFANKAMSAAVDANGASFKSNQTAANVSPGGAQLQFNNGDVAVQTNTSTTSGQRTAAGVQTISASQNTMTIEFMANDPSGWRTLQTYRRQNWNIINYEILSYGAIRIVLFRQQR